MNRILGLKFAEALSNMEGRDYIKSMVAFGAAPTIQGKKPSSLLVFNSSGRNTVSLWKEYGEETCKFFNLECFELKSSGDCIMVLLYRKKMLEWYASNRRNQPFLGKMGYGIAENLEQKLQILKQRFETLCPHEVGIFLGMPVEDVEGFIEHKGKNCLTCRYWKVYGNPKRAQLLFNAYDRAREVMAEFVIKLETNNMVQYM